MIPTTPALDHGLAKALRQRRAELRESMDALEAALAAPALESQVRWRQRVHGALTDLSAGFQDHVGITEGPDGLYDELRTKAPRLTHSVDRLGQEHEAIAELLGALLARTGPDAEGEAEGAAELIREQGTTLLGLLVRHRQRGADLVFEAYEFDIGGET